MVGVKIGYGSLLTNANFATSMVASATHIAIQQTATTTNKTGSNTAVTPYLCPE
jgi:hypothetical protein